MVKVLGIEGTAHTIGVGIVDGEEVLANAFHTYVPAQGGFVPRELADHHARYFPAILQKALQKAGLSLSDVDVVAFSQGPGIGAPLSFTAAMARYLAVKHNLPLVGVNHPLAHVLIAEKFYSGKAPVAIYVSGGNTQILVKEGAFYKVMGETLDVGLGNLFDNVARLFHLSPPNGGALARLAEKGRRYISLPYTVKGTNVAFSGLLNAIERLMSKERKVDLAFSLFHTTFAALLEVAERVFHLVGGDGFLLCGGVAQNTLLKAMAKALAEENGAAFAVAPDEYNRDNGAMIAYAGYKLYTTFGSTPLSLAFPKPYYRIDEVEQEVMAWRQRRH